MKKLVIFYILVVASYLSKAQQDPQYSQYMFNQLVINPAYTGTKEALSAVVDLRKQWVAMPGSPQTGTISMHGPIFNGFGLGGHLITESIGPASWTAAYADFGYHFKLGKGKLSFGLSAGVINYNVNVNKLDYKNGGEPMLNYTGQQSRFDVSTGFYYYSPSFYIGGSLTHLTSPNLYSGSSTINVSPNVQKNVSLFFSLQPHSFLYLGKGFQVNDNLVINPSLMIKSITGTTSSIDLNCNFLLKNRIWLGVSLRSGYGIVGLVQVYITDKFKVGYAYDQGLNKIGIAGQSSHEVVLSYNFNAFKSKILSPRYL